MIGSEERQPVETAEPRARRILLRLGLFTGIAIAGYIDYLTGREIGFSLFYLVPIAIAGWYVDRTTALAVAGAASIAWIAAELAWRPESLAIALWNGFTRVVIYTSQAWLVATVKRDQLELHAAIAHEKLLARTDSITGLANSRAFVEMLEHPGADKVLGNGQPLSLVYIDLDDFKSINDEYGHSAGDDVLERVAHVLRTETRSTDLVARLGGDEFALLLAADQAHAEAVAERILGSIHQISRDYERAKLGASAGIAHCASGACEAERLINTADAAMYAAKERGKNCIVIQTYEDAPAATAQRQQTS